MVHHKSGKKSPFRNFTNKQVHHKSGETFFEILQMNKDGASAIFILIIDGQPAQILLLEDHG